MNNVSHPLTAKIPAALGILIVTLVIVGAIVITQHSMPTAIATTPSNAPSTSSSNQTYKNGTYSAIGSYSSPAGMEDVAVSLTLTNGIVTDSTVMRRANDQTASSYQGLFISGYKAQVTGKKISDIKLSNVAGSSLTPKGFMDALNKIKTEAKA